MSKKLLSLILILGLVFSSSFKAQSLDETLSKLSSTVGSAYVKPIISAFGSNLNSGWVSQFPSATPLSFHIDLKIVAMGSFFSDNVKTFTATDQFYFDQNQTNSILANSGITPSSPGYQNAYNQIYGQPFTVTFSGPTIIGSKDENLVVRFPGKPSVNVNAVDVQIPVVKGYLPEALQKIFPTATAQLTVGTVFGTNLAIRYFPDVNIGELGKSSYFGVGLIHNFGVWFPNPLPLDLTVGYFTQKLKVGTIFESNASQYGIYASKTLGIIVSFTPYIGLTVETSKTTVSYDYTSNQTLNGVPVKAHISVDLEGENKSSAVIGFNLHLGIVNINADYKLAKTKTVSAGISFGF
ncbi:MAG: hypothetical protein NTX65_05885 [Ignavibacteriales bacterium]|nr:hypothetical protein [Ignavibacteriales bacterium]